jgi:hypothetical protein
LVHPLHITDQDFKEEDSYPAHDWPLLLQRSKTNLLTIDYDVWAYGKAERKVNPHSKNQVPTLFDIEAKTTFHDRGLLADWRYLRGQQLTWTINEEIGAQPSPIPPNMVTNLQVSINLYCWCDSGRKFLRG